MPRQNRVTPHGDLIAVSDRGLFWGNRGSLLDGQRRLARYSGSRTWVICVLEFKGRHRKQQWVPGRLTELYFLDEATGLAAGHRPCGECRHRDYQAFKRAWAAAHGAGGGPSGRGLSGGGLPGGGGGLPGAQAMDARLHADRVTRPRVRRSYTAPLAELPDGAMIELGGEPWLVYGGGLLAWTPGGYLSRDVKPPAAPVTVITPRATVATLAAGYRPVIHPTADVSAETRA